MWTKDYFERQLGIKSEYIDYLRKEGVLKGKETFEDADVLFLISSKETYVSLKEVERISGLSTRKVYTLSDIGFIEKRENGKGRLQYNKLDAHVASYNQGKLFTTHTLHKSTGAGVKTIELLTKQGVLTKYPKTRYGTEFYTYESYLTLLEYTKEEVMTYTKYNLVLRTGITPYHLKGLIKEGVITPKINIKGKEVYSQEQFNTIVENLNRGYSASEVSDRSGLSISVLYELEKLGLLVPQRNYNNSRYYTEEQLNKVLSNNSRWLKRVYIFKVLGVDKDTLEELDNEFKAVKDNGALSLIHLKLSKEIDTSLTSLNEYTQYGVTKFCHITGLSYDKLQAIKELKLLEPKYTTTGREYYTYKHIEEYKKGYLKLYTKKDVKVILGVSEKVLKALGNRKVLNPIKLREAKEYYTTQIIEGYLKKKKELDFEYDGGTTEFEYTAYELAKILGVRASNILYLESKEVIIPKVGLDGNKYYTEYHLKLLSKSKYIKDKQKSTNNGDE